MPRIDVVLESPVTRSFRVDQVAGVFDVPLAEKSRLELSVDVPGVPPDDDGWGDWTIGAIVGPSGSGKSVIARKAFGKNLIERHTWPRSKPMIDAIAPGSVELKQVADLLNAVGFSSPPAWVLPYQVLSNGQQFRADLARAMLAKRPVLAYDEFTSVVDRQVGRFASTSVAKAVRKGRAGCERFVAVTCHYDVLDWLEPDWVLDMSKRELARGCLQRPRIELDIRRCKRDLWRVFAPHHYLTGKIHPAARCYIALWEAQPIAFTSTISNAGHRGRRLMHRTVVLPDYQGMGIGMRLRDAVAEMESAEGYRISTRTGHPAMIFAMKRSERWSLRSVNRPSSAQRGFVEREARRLSGGTRMTAAFEWVG